MFDGGMVMRFQASSCLLQLVGGVNSGGAHLKTRSFAAASSSFSARASPSSSSLLLQIDKRGVSESRSGDLGGGSAPMGSASSFPAFAQSNTVGIIGGVSAACTLNFLENLVGWSSKEGQESLPFLVCSDPALSRELPSQRWAASSSSQAAAARSSLDRDGLVEKLRHKRVFLERSGARCIVMPCHFCHYWHREVADGCSVPFLHVGECVAKELKSANLRPVEAGSNVRIGVLATDTPLAAGYYQDQLQSLGFEVVLPDKATMEHTVIPAVEALNRKDMEGARTLIRIAMQVLLVRAVNRIILATHDMQGLLPSGDPLLKKCIDPMDALARSTIEWARSAKIMHTST